MSAASWGAIAGVLIAVAIPMAWPVGGAMGALLVPVYAIVLAPIGWVVGRWWGGPGDTKE